MSPNKYAIANMEFFPSFYLTLISIIQSLTFGIFLEGLDYKLIFTSQFNWFYFLQSLPVFTLIFLVWYEYAMGTASYRWVFGIVDSILPFAYGFSQYYLIKLISESELNDLWLAFLCVFIIITLIAYLNMDIKAFTLVNKKLSFKFMCRAVPISTYIYLLITVLFWGLYLYSNILFFLSDFVFLIIVNLMILGFVIHRELHWFYILRKEKISNLPMD